MICLSCRESFHGECGIGNSCCCTNSTEEVLSVSAVAERSDEATIDRGQHSTRRIQSRKTRRKAYQRKSDRGLKDQQSTGRKRAAVLYALDETLPCEWRGLRYAGGGVQPIIGCLDGLQTNRHHGPDKNTLNNDPENVHRICATCHNRWHARNDPNYDWEGVHNQHDPDTKASLEEIVNSELEWRVKPPPVAKGD